MCVWGSSHDLRCYLIYAQKQKFNRSEIVTMSNISILHAFIPKCPEKMLFS